MSTTRTDANDVTEPVARVLAALPDARRNGKGWQARCPVHDDRVASLSIGVGDNGGAVIYCQAGCATEDVAVALGLTMADLMPASDRNGNGAPKRIVATYDYRDESGELLFQVVRFHPPKDFRQRKRNGSGWNWSVKGVRVVPFRLPELMAAPDAVVFVVEGEKDVDNLAAVGLVATCNAGGAGKWRDKHAAFLKGRHVVILPDNDDPGRKHAEQVASSLSGIAASVRIVELSNLPEKGDVSDWLTAGGTKDELMRLVDAAAQWTAHESNGKEPGGSAPARGKSDTTGAAPGENVGLVKRLADHICRAEHFAQDVGGKLYRYQAGVYKAHAEKFVKGTVKRLVNEWKISKAWSPKLAGDAVEYIRVDSPELWDRPPLEVVNVRNGFVRVVDKVLLPHTPDHLSTVQLPITFDASATCSSIDQFVGEVFPSDAVHLAYEIPAYLMRPSMKIQKAILFRGAGGEGKSAFLAMIRSFLGKQNTTALSLHKIEADKFAAGRLVGKLANICADLPSEHLAGTSMFKQIVGGDEIPGEYKYHDSFEFSPFCRLVFSANSPPRSSDSSQGFFDRWLVIPFDRQFRGTREEIPRDILDARLSAPGEMSGLLNRALDALADIEHRGFGEADSVKAAWAEFRTATDPLAVWLDQNTVDDPAAVVVKQELRRAFNGHLSRKGQSPVTDNQFGREFGKHRPLVELRQRTVNHKMQWCYVGIGMLSGDENS
jgi:putative DNA primase/helicase